MATLDRTSWVISGIRLVPHVIAAVHAVESLATAKSGKEKQDAAVEAVQAALEITEASMGRDVVDNPKVEQAVRQLIDAYIAVQNAVASVRDVRARQVPRPPSVVTPDDPPTVASASEKPF